MLLAKNTNNGVKAHALSNEAAHKLIVTGKENIPSHNCVLLLHANKNQWHIARWKNVYWI